MLTRYEEYLKYHPDNFGRFEASESLAYKNGFLEDPIVEKWVEMFKKALKQKYPGMIFTTPVFSHIPTINVDSAFAYLHKGLIRTLAATIKNIFNREYKEIYLRYRTLLRRVSDKSDNFDYLETILSERSNKPVFFFLSGRYSRFDRNISLQKKAMKNLVAHVAKFACTGLHPSYLSNRELHLVGKERERLESCINASVECSRQHYLKLQFPQTYHNLIKHGITEDYSMGYATRPGFRAGTCTPYNFYDLSKDKETTLKVYPFQTMDTTFQTYLLQTPEEAQEKILHILHKVKEVGGIFISLWHNDTFATTETGIRWRKVFENVLTLT